MGTYQVPRDVKGEGRILFIFSKKALIYTAIGIVVGFFFVFLFGLIKLKIIGYILLVILGVLGFLIGTFKMPKTTAFEITKKTGGENIDDIIKRAIKFKRNGRRIYIYDKKENLRINIDKTNDKKEDK